MYDYQGKCDLHSLPYNITWTYVDSDLRLRTASLGHNTLYHRGIHCPFRPTPVEQKIRHIISLVYLITNGNRIYVIYHTM